MLNLFVYIFVFILILNEMLEKNDWYGVLGMKCICKSYFEEIIFIFNVYIKILDFLIKKCVIKKYLIWFCDFFFCYVFVVFGFILLVIVIYNKLIYGGIF